MKITCVVAASLAVLAGSANSQVGENQGVLNANLAKPDQLQRLPHVTEGLAKKIVALRPIRGMEELHAELSKVLDENQCTELYAKLFIPINLNTASREEILLVPGVGPRMAHEFEEYRPYKALAQFRREMGKYVDDEEVARLEQFVFVPLDLNRASSEDLATIPGVGKRMVHEFEEYRPYRAMAQFRREIGKYVDEKEVARLERYFESIGVVNPNVANPSQLAALPHLTEELVELIVEQRPFLGMDKLHAALKDSLDDRQRASLYARMFIPINLNSASREEILLVPGAGERMAHEFEEYRPYVAMAQFRREIGKYVDEAQVARFEQYVFVPLDLNKATEEDFATIPGVGKRMIHEFMEYRPYKAIEQFRREIGKYVDDKEVARLERYVFVK